MNSWLSAKLGWATAPLSTYVARTVPGTVATSQPLSSKPSVEISSPEKGACGARCSFQAPPESSWRAPSRTGAGFGTACVPPWPYTSHSLSSNGCPFSVPFRHRRT